MSHVYKQWAYGHEEDTELIYHSWGEYLCASSAALNITGRWSALPPYCGLCKLKKRYLPLTLSNGFKLACRQSWYRKRAKWLSVAKASRYMERESWRPGVPWVRIGRWPDPVKRCRNVKRGEVLDLWNTGLVIHWTCDTLQYTGPLKHWTS